MTRFILKRLAHAIGVLWATFTAAFLLLYVLPGDAALSKMNLGGGSGFSVEALAKMRAYMGLDRPVWQQYLSALRDAVRGKFGVSVQTGQDALHMFAAGIPETLKLAGLALLIGLALGIGVALLGAYTRSSALRGLLSWLPVVGVSIPSFWIGLILLQVFSFQLKLLPGMGNDGLASLVLPSTVLAIPTAALIAQILFQSLNDILASPYIVTAKGHGAGRLRRLLGHALRNAIIPVITALGMTTGNLIAGSVVVETVFSRSGIGLLTVKAVLFQDTPIVLVAVLFAATVFVTVNLLVDILYPFIDPRIEIGVRRPKVMGPTL
ncbi:ABC transporter permease [Sodalis sp. dw_96]|uniref:ABC transporter permease n=1 Tax=Sodalis sp. dw_96 TaxID=2719794 RepID=UPI001BD50350|nr:ABC transporter permease [Sodalis sp. dw_96]